MKSQEKGSLKIRRIAICGRRSAVSCMCGSRCVKHNRYLIAVMYEPAAFSVPGSDGDSHRASNVTRVLLEDVYVFMVNE